MEELELTQEQKYLLRRVEIEARAMSKDELVEALCTSSIAVISGDVPGRSVSFMSNVVCCSFAFC